MSGEHPQIILPYFYALGVPYQNKRKAVYTLMKNFLVLNRYVPILEYHSFADINIYIYYLQKQEERLPENIKILILKDQNKIGAPIKLFLLVILILKGMKKSEAELLIEELRVRFERKPRKCKKKNDSGIGTSERIVCISNDRFYYYPKIQEFNDLDFDKLQYVVPKAGIKLSEILELKFPPRRNNERNYFTIIIPKNKILKYTKTFKEMIIDETAEGEQDWTFVFEYDIVSLPELQKRANIIKTQEQEKLLKKKQKEEEQILKQEEETRKKMEQEYDSLLQAEKFMSEKQIEDGKQSNRQQNNEEEQKVIEEADQYFYQQAYSRLLRLSGASELEIIEHQLEVIEAIGRFKKRAQKSIKKYVDELPFSGPIPDKPFIYDNFLITIQVSQDLNLHFLDTTQVAYALYAAKHKIDNKIRVPLMAFFKYKGIKALVRALTPCDTFSEKEKDQMMLHGNMSDNWKTHFFLVDDLNMILESMNLKPYNSELYFQRIVIHLGIQLQLISTKEDPFHKVRNFDKNKEQLKPNRQNLMYLFNIKQIFPIDLDLQKNIKQNDVRLRPQYVQSYRQNQGSKQLTKLVGGALTYEFEDEEGNKDDITLARACQSLKYIHLVNFVADLDKLKYIPMNSQHLGHIMKSNGFNMRYISAIFKLTSLPYIQEMITVQAVSREIKKIYRDYQAEYMKEVFRQKNMELIRQAFGNKGMKSLKVIRIRQLQQKQRTQSIQNAIDFLNLIFGNGVETQNFWEIVKKKVKDKYKIYIKQHTDLSHGYLLTTVLYRCGFVIKLNSNILLFSAPEPFSSKDWVQFKCKSFCYTYPSFQVYKKSKITSNLTEEAIINRLELSLLINRTFGFDESKILSEIATITKNPEVFSIEKGEKYSVEVLKYLVANASVQNFGNAFDICSLILPSSHPYFQDLYLQYASLKSQESITLKKSAQNHAIRTLGIRHWRTSSILSGFNQQSYLRHLIQAEKGVEKTKKLELYRKIAQEQQRIGQLTDSIKYVQLGVVYANENKDLTYEMQQEFFQLMLIGMAAAYLLRKISDMLSISGQFWNQLQLYRKNNQSQDYFEQILYYCLKGYLQSSTRKYYLFKIVLVVNEKIINQKEIPKKKLLADIREKCRQSKNQINWIEELLIKLQFAYTQINYLPDFFINFWKNIKKLHSQELQEGLSQMEYLIRLFSKKYFQQALLDRSYSFDKGTEWVLPK